MPEYLAPGVFIEEIDSGSKPIEGVGVNTAAFIGYAKSGEFNTPTFISNWTQFCQEFGEPEAAYLKGLAEQLGESKAELLESKQASNKGWGEYAHSRLEAAMGSTNGDRPASLTAKSWPDFLDKYKDSGIRESTPFMEDSYLAYAVRGFYDNGGGRAYIVRVPRPQDIEARMEVASSNGHKAMPAARAATLALAPMSLTARHAGAEGNDIKVEVQHVGDNDFRVKITGDGRTEEFPSQKPDEGADAAKIVEAINEHSKLLKGEIPKAQTQTKTATATRPKTGVFNLENGFTAPAPADIVPAYSGDLEEIKTNDFIGEEEKRSGAKGLASIEDLNMICAPDLMAGLFTRKITQVKDAYNRVSEVVEPEKMITGAELEQRRQMILDSQIQLVNYCEMSGDRMAILDPLPGLKPKQMLDITMNTSYNADHGQAAIYYPWIKVADPLHKGKQRLVPPCGHIAGVWARVGVERGVHKAPANEGLLGAVDMEYQVTKGEQEILNPIGVNCIRTFPGQGIRVWGARTLATVGNPSWKYVNVRRLFNYLERSMERGLQWVVFEPNDHDLWGRVRRNLSAFLWTEWKEGKLFGTSADQAFYVKCDAETNPQEMIDLGRLYVEIGINPVKPAEFVIVRIGQWSGGGNTSEG